MGQTITPGHIGDATIGMTSGAVKAALGGPRSHESDEMVFADYPGLVVSTYEGLVNMLIVESAEAGSTELGVAVGMSWIELDRRLGPFEYDSDNALWVSSKTPGIWYEIARPPREDEEPIDPPLVTEVYQVLDPKNAIVRRIYVM